MTSINGNTITARTINGPVTVGSTPSTKISQTSGIAAERPARQQPDPGPDHHRRGRPAGRHDHGREHPLQGARLARGDRHRAGTSSTGAISELRQAIIDGKEYVIREEVTVFFASGSAAISSQHQQQLRQLAQNAASHGNYRISILGFADPRGNAAANERLSLRRAGAVSNYLRQTGSIQPGRVLSPSAMGETAALRTKRRRPAMPKRAGSWCAWSPPRRSCSNNGPRVFDLREVPEWSCG